MRQAKPTTLASPQESSETEKLQLVKAYLNVRLPDGRVKRVLAGLDTQANVSFVNEGLGVPRKWEPGESPLVNGFNEQTEVTKAVSFTVMQGKHAITLPARLEPRGGFPRFLMAIVTPL